MPSLWHQLVASTTPRRSAAFTRQHSTTGPMFGIGVLAPNARGTAEPDNMSAWRAWGLGSDAWHSLCQAARHLCREVTMPGPAQHLGGRTAKG